MAGLCNYKFIVKVLLCFLFLSLPAFADDIVRVGLTDNKFQNVLKQQVIVYGTADCDICDKATKRTLLHVDSDTNITVKNGLAGMSVVVNDQSATLRDFVIVCPSGLLGVRDLKRKGKDALYHGAFELIKNNNNMFRVRNT